MSLDQYLNSDNIIKSSKPLDAMQLRAVDADIINHELVEITKFDDPALDEVIELHVYNILGSYTTSDHEADHWKHFATEDSFIQFDVAKNFEDLGINQGSYKLVLNFHRTLIGNDNNPNLYIKQISPDRTELLIKIGNDVINQKLKSTTTLDVPEVTTKEQLMMFHTRRQELCGESGFRNLLFMNFGRNELYQFVNYVYLQGMEELYVKLYQPLPLDVREKRRFWIVQQVRQPYTDNVVLYKKPVVAPSRTLKGPNFETDVKYGKIVETNFQNWNELLGSSLSTSQQIIDKVFSGSLAGSHLGIDYSGFQNFVNYSSGAERIANFKYKVGLIEYYDAQVGTLNNISESSEVNANKVLYRKYKDNVIGGFDGFEKYLYYENLISGSHYTHGVSGSNIFHDTFHIDTWPKEGYGVSTTGKPVIKNQYTLCHTTSSQAIAWYEGIHASASLWDVHNSNALIKTVPEHIRDDAQNSEFEIFVNMIGHHYDIMWSYIKHQTDVWNRDEHYAHGLSKDLLYDAAKGLGWHLVNGNQSERLFEYLLGTNEEGEYGKINERSIKDLHLYVPFDEGRPDFARKNFIDYSGNLNLLEDYSQPTFVKGKHGHGAYFDGSNYLKYNTVIDYSNKDYAVSFWVKDVTQGGNGVTEGIIFDASSGSYGTTAAGSGFVVKSHKNAGIHLNQYYSGSGGYHGITLGHATSSYNRAVSSSYLDIDTVEGASTNGNSNGWHHILFNVDRSANMTSYFDGVLVDTTDISVSSSHDIGPEQTGDYPKPIIGARDEDNSGTPTSNFVGSLDEFRVYNRLLSADEISELYTNVTNYVTQSSATVYAEPKEGLTHQVWRRVVNNLPYLLKTKGTSRSVKALLSCYGIPESLLSIREYGGPKMAKTEPAGIYDQFTYALEFASGSGGHSSLVWPADYYNTTIGNWGYIKPYLTEGADIPEQTREFRFKPAITSSMLLFSTAYHTSGDHRIMSHLAIEHTGSYSGSGNYGRVHLIHGRSMANTTPMSASSDWVPIYDGNFWNLRWYWQATGSDSGIYNNAANLNTTYHVQVQQASDYVTGQIVHSASLSLTPIFPEHFNAWATSNESRGSHLGGNTGSYSNGNQHKCNEYLNRALHGNDVSIPSPNTQPGCGTFSGSMQEYREWLEDLGQSAFDKHTLNPKSYVSSLSPSSSFDTLVRHYPLGTNQIGYDHTKTLFISSSHPNQAILDFSDPSGSDSGDTYATASGFLTPADTVNNDHYERVDETYYIHGPSIGGKNLKSAKIRIEDNKLVHPLDHETRGEVSEYDIASTDSNKLGIFFSPQDMINKDIYNQIGGTALDDYFGSAEDQYKDEYPRYKNFAYQYWKKYDNDNDLNAYIRIFALFDFSFFTQVKQLIPVRTNADVGLIIEPSILERSKVMVEAQPSREELHWEDTIPDPFPDPLMEPLHYTASIGVTEPVHGEPMHYTASIDNKWTADAEHLTYTSSIPGNIINLTSDMSGSLTSSINITTGSMSADHILVLRMPHSGSNDAPDPGIDLFRIQNGYPGAVYKHVGVVLSGSTWITSSKHSLEYSPTGSHVYEQRKSATFQKKVFHYGPADAAARHYPLNVRKANGKFLDLTTNYAHSISHSKVLAGDTANSSTGNPLPIASPQYESVTHNRFTGNLLVISCSLSQSVDKRGKEYVQIPNLRLGGDYGYKERWTLSWLMKEAAGFHGTGSIFMGADNDTATSAEDNNPSMFTATSQPYFALSSAGPLQVRALSADYWSSPKKIITSSLNDRTDLNHFVITYDGREPSNAVMEFWQNGISLGTSSKAIGSDPVNSGSFGFEAIGSGYVSGTRTLGFSGSIGQVRAWNKKLTTQDIRYLNKYPHLRAERDIDTQQRRGRETMTRRIRSNGFAPLTDLGQWATSHSLQPADYRDDPADSSYYEGSKLTAPAINVPSTDDINGEEVVKVTIRNRYSLVYKKDLPDGANLDVV